MVRPSQSVLLFATAVGWCLAVAVPAARSDDGKGLEFFEKKIRPLLVERCYECHSTEKGKTKGDFALDSREAMLKGGESGVALVPGDLEKSKIIEAVRYKNQDFQMPPKKPLSSQEVADLEAWVKMGAPDPREKAVVSAKGKRVIDITEGRKFWSFQPIADPAVPHLQDGDRQWVKSPVDAFVLAKMKSAGLHPAEPADKRTLIRRATFDLTGLPPTPEDVDAFVNDKSSDAFSRVIDRLLNSPAYGERWGRHWLDVARYADSNGMDENIAFGQAWRYRDYVVKAFNEDKPFDRFVVEQLAGDLLPVSSEPERIENLTATGFLALGAKVLAEPDVRKMEMDVIDEQIDVLGKAFLGMTFGCCRCHDHKFDPVPTTDYYAMAAIFRGTRSMAPDNKGTIKYWYEHPMATPEEIAAKKAHEATISAQKKKVAEYKAKAEPKDELLEKMNAELAELESQTRDLPSIMGVAEGDVAKTLPVHIRGSYLTLGRECERGFPQVMQTSLVKPILPAKQSGRLEFARWIASAEHPLTARVIVNRLWRWHFGRGIVSTTDNLGTLGDRPSHPELLDWLARRFIADGWSMKDMHRLIMNSSAYQQSCSFSYSMADNPAVEPRDPRVIDPENRLLSHFSIQRLEAEQIRDSLLAISGWIDPQIGGKTIPLHNKEFVFNHTSKDRTTYESPRRAVYLPVIRNHLYDMLEQFDYPDPTMPTGSRNSTVVAPQALMMLNADVTMDAADRLAAKLLTSRMDDAARIDCAYRSAYARPPVAGESKRAIAYILELKREIGANTADTEACQKKVWSLFCQTLLGANEFMYLR